MRHWTQEERQKQSALIREWQPWKDARGAATPAGKAKSKMNAYKHGFRSESMRDLFAFLAEQKKDLVFIKKHDLGL